VSQKIQYTYFLAKNIKCTYNIYYPLVPQSFYLLSIIAPTHFDHNSCPFSPS